MARSSRTGALGLDAVPFLRAIPAMVSGSATSNFVPIVVLQVHVAGRRYVVSSTAH